MKEAHLNNEVLDRFARGDLDDATLSDVLEHLEGCEECARAGQNHAASDLAALRAGWTNEPAAPQRPALLWILAAAAAIALVALTIFLRPKQRPSHANPTITAPRPGPEPTIPSTTTTNEERYDDPEWQDLVTRALQSGRLPFPKDLAELRAPADIVRGGTGSDERITPTGVVIDDVRPAFTWPAREGGTYTVFVFDDDRKVIESPALKNPRWTTDRDLPRGRTLTWQVEVRGAGPFETIPSPPSPQAMFRIAKESDHQELVRARDRHSDDDFLLAVLYARSGMRAEALDALRRAATANDAAKRILNHETSSVQ